MFSSLKLTMLFAAGVGGAAVLCPLCGAGLPTAGAQPTQATLTCAGSAPAGLGATDGGPRRRRGAGRQPGARAGEPGAGGACASRRAGRAPPGLPPQNGAGDDPGDPPPTTRKSNSPPPPVI